VDRQVISRWRVLVAGAVALVAAAVVAASASAGGASTQTAKPSTAVIVVLRNPKAQDQEGRQAQVGPWLTHDGHDAGPAIGRGSCRLHARQFRLSAPKSAAR
jgi:hypothetical protein